MVMSPNRENVRWEVQILQDKTGPRSLVFVHWRHRQ